MPFSPRSILIYRKDVKSIVEITSIGTEHYETSISTVVPGRLLDRKGIDFCLKNLTEIARADSTIRICSLFTRQSCESDFYDTKHLYLDSFIQHYFIINNLVNVFLNGFPIIVIMPK